MSYKVDENTLREFMRKYYPKYADNMALARILYAKHVGALVGSVPLVTSEQLNDYVGLAVRAFGILAGYSVVVYEACPRCGASIKKCRCSEKGDSVKRYVYELTVGDNFGNYRVVFWSDNDGAFKDDDIGREVEVVGIVSSDGDDVIIKARDVKFKEFNEGGKIGDFLNILKDMGKVRKEVVLNMAKMYGVSMDKLSKYLKEENGFCYIVGGETE